MHIQILLKYIYILTCEAYTAIQIYIVPVAGCGSESSFDFNAPDTISDACKLYTYDNILYNYYNIRRHGLTEHNMIQIST